mmetsp:Transcript_32293/g.76129  ORF Transcript_32293/g.76129 Transcript_32293/m.76129 type:complete len:332 (-) Transcript_32293:680-1675(-)
MPPSLLRSCVACSASCVRARSFCLCTPTSWRWAARRERTARSLCRMLLSCDLEARSSFLSSALLSVLTGVLSCILVSAMTSSVSRAWPAPPACIALSFAPGACSSACSSPLARIWRSSACTELRSRESFGPCCSAALSSATFLRAVASVLSLISTSTCASCTLSSARRTFFGSRPWSCTVRSFSLATSSLLRSSPSFLSASASFSFHALALRSSCGSSANAFTSWCSRDLVLASRRWYAFWAEAPEESLPLRAEESLGTAMPCETCVRMGAAACAEETCARSCVLANCGLSCAGARACSSMAACCSCCFAVHSFSSSVCDSFCSCARRSCW